LFSLGTSGVHYEQTHREESIDENGCLNDWLFFRPEHVLGRKGAIDCLSTLEIGGRFSPPDAYFLCGQGETVGSVFADGMDVRTSFSLSYRA